MFGRTRYIDWAYRLYGTVELDLASSGIPVARWSELGIPVPDVDDPTGYPRFRQAIATYNQVDVAEVAPALGTSGAIFLAYASVLSPGDEVLVESPAYEPLVRAAEGLGATVRHFERRAEDGFRVDPERVAACVGPRTRVIAVTNLHNPTGVRIPDRTLAELALVAEARGAYLLVDEVYAPFDDLAEDGIFRGSARKLAKNVIAIGSLTKCYGLGMQRFGWILAEPELQPSIEAATIAMCGHFPLVHACLGAAAFTAVPALSRRAKALFTGKREIAEAWSRTQPNVSWSAPTSGLYGFVTVKGKGDLTKDIEALAEKSGVLVGAGAFFGVPNGFRLSWATLPADRFRQGLERLAPLVA
jgi:aspartate/methionine/tyrosine aminotransferase